MNSDIVLIYFQENLFKKDNISKKDIFSNYKKNGSPFWLQVIKLSSNLNEKNFSPYRKTFGEIIREDLQSSESQRVPSRIKYLFPDNFHGMKSELNFVNVKIGFNAKWMLKLLNK